ncbi:universal stress protein Aq_178 [bacterium BMS3Abin07]|nr:universal stress protein Aq_178 [bacterium BMS3Abin07]GBE32237.1 universal stress protein Aq_178 [bacterium BMS3Bbin05]HDL21224.1 universal stress protein [Nitrospirota bacterium]HDO23289.1 universal stress protein [Nitrospirota bacterium]HDZ87811.1 universal stress protein [Nitrospirota bacterium]
MNDINRILVVSRMTRYCRKAVHFGVSLSQKYGSELYVIHVIHNPFSLEGWNLPVPSLAEEYKRIQQDAKKELDRIIAQEKQKGMSIKELVREGQPTGEILKVVREEGIDLIVMLAHEEGHLEHFLFGRSNKDIIRKVPCSILLVKKEPEPVAF